MEDDVKVNSQDEYNVKLSAEEQQMVNEKVDHFKKNVALDGDRLEDMLRRAGVDTDKVKALNERIDNYKPSKDYADNESRLKGFSSASPVGSNPKIDKKEEDLRSEVKDLKEAVKSLTEIIREKLS